MVAIISLSFRPRFGRLIQRTGAVVRRLLGHSSGVHSCLRLGRDQVLESWREHLHTACRGVDWRRCRPEVLQVRTCHHHHLHHHHHHQQIGNNYGYTSNAASLTRAIAPTVWQAVAVALGGLRLSAVFRPLLINYPHYQVTITDGR
jgi:hypothetical protein